MNARRIAMAIGCFLFTSAGARAGQTRSAAGELITGVHEARRQIRSGRFKFVMTKYSEKGYGPRGHEVREEFDVILRAPAVRVTHRDSLPSTLGWKLPPEMKGDPGDITDPEVVKRLRAMGAMVDRDRIETAIFLRDVAYQYLDGDVLRIWDPEALHSRYKYLDPVCVGVALDGEEWNHRGIDAILPKDEAWEEVSAADTPPGVHVLERRIVSGARRGIERVWIDTRKDFSVLRRELHMQEHTYDSVLQATLQQGPGGRWYPLRVECSVDINGKTDRSMVIEVLEADFDAEIDDAEFSVVSMGVPPEQTVFDLRTQGQVGHWTGSEIVMDDVSGEPVAAVVGAAPGRWTRWLWGFAGVAALGAALAFWRRRRAGAMT